MQRRSFSREFKVEAVRLVRERGVSVAQAARDLDVHENVLRKWVQQLADDPLEAFPGSGKMKAAEAESERLRREVHELKAERDILQKPRPTSRRARRDVCACGEGPGDLADGDDVRGARCLAQWLLRVADARSKCPLAP